MNKFLLNFFILSFLFIGVSNISAQSSIPERSNKIDNGKSELIIFPNPAKDFVKLSSKALSIKIRNVKIYSIIGVEIANFTVNQYQTELPLEKLKPGKYLISFEMADGQLIVKQIVKM